MKMSGELTIDLRNAKVKDFRKVNNHLLDTKDFHLATSRDFPRSCYFI